jgi:hydrogenase maturation protein HypF
MVNEICVAMRNTSSINQVVLSGGVWQNMVLLQKTVKLLREADFEVMSHFAVPPNDGGLALGQAAIATHRLKYDQ